MDKDIDAVIAHHNATRQYLADFVKGNSHMALGGQSWGTTNVSGGYVFAVFYVRVNFTFIFPNGPTLNYTGNGGGFGAASGGITGGIVTFDVDPNSLIGQSPNFSIATANVGFGGIQVGFWQGTTQIGHGSFSAGGLGMAGGGGTGQFS